MSMDTIIIIAFIITVIADILMPICVALESDEDFRRIEWEVTIPYWVMMVAFTPLYPVILF